MNLDLIIQFLKKYAIEIAIILLLFFGTLIILLVATAKNGHGPHNVAPEDVKYCHIKSCPENTHTLCKYPNILNNRCGTCTGLDDAGKEQILKLHNDYREYVGLGLEKRGNPGPQRPRMGSRGKAITPPIPEAILPMAWSDELARIAQRWANQCIVDHDKCRDIPRWKVGQNIGYMTGKNVTSAQIFDLWKDEVKDFHNGHVERYRANSKTGHYTQIVWERSISLGCEFLKCEKGTKQKNYLVCNYGPAGNIIGQQIYLTQM